MAEASSSSNPFAYNPDGSAVDPIAFRDALMADPEKLRVIEADKELAAALLGDDTARIQVRATRGARCAVTLSSVTLTPATPG
jgi:hypothetical protein